jgi:hypothetical protein
MTNIVICWQILAELPSIEFHENSFRGSQDITVDRQDMAKWRVTFFQLSIMNAPKTD